MARSGYSKGDLKINERAMETAEFLKFFNSLFDSVNGFATLNSKGKHLRTSIDLKTGLSSRKNFWREAVHILAGMHTIDEKGRQKVAPSFKNWIFTSKNFIILVDLLKTVGFKKIVLRYVNQDPLENFFGKIRQRRIRYTNPTCTAFGSFYKSLLVNSFTSNQSVEYNCEQDNCNVLITLKTFLETHDEPASEDINREFEAFVISEEFNVLKPLEEIHYKKQN